MKSVILILTFQITMMFSTFGQDRPHAHNAANEHMHSNSMEELTQRFEDETRAQWQKPDEVIALLGDIKGKTIMDIGAGTGYFAFRLAKNGAHVIAADVNDEFQRFIAGKKKELNYGDDLIELRKIPYDSPQLEPGEAHAVIIVNTYHHIEDRIAYFSKVLQGLKPDGVLMVVDFSKEEFDEDTPGPPAAIRISAEKVVEELQASGYSACDINRQLLPYQYIITASR